MVWGKIYKAAELKQLEHQMKMQQEQNIFNALAMERREEIMNLRRNRDREGLMELQDKLAKMAMEKSKELGAPSFTPHQVEAYTTVGGTPFLDGGYTVFGEVEEGLDIVEAIQNAETSMGDRPKTDVVMTVTVVE
jgi:peptidyl-prolyl cis-trans isomerase B (cyclophilin B)